MEYTIKQISEIIGGKISGDENLCVTGVSSIENAVEGDISFIKDENFVRKVLDTKASAVVSHRSIEETKKALIIVDNPFLAFIKLLKVISDEKQQRPREIHPSAVISKDSSIGDNISVGANVVIDGSTQIGQNVTIYPNVYIGTNCKIGD
ncbi:MAG: UDP-3-O-(3-hydroxymyristoyl)glucosamine N-acyltransferase, partial [Candidatus Scalindua sp.]|nr:UDP-3-O-(3-hydroxymyristoyl)glucosamine N-acyltransferase [Candidatus Scalindua sp.]